MRVRIKADILITLYENSFWLNRGDIGILPGMIQGEDTIFPDHLYRIVMENHSRNINIRGSYIEPAPYQTVQTAPKVVYREFKAGDMVEIVTCSNYRIIGEKGKIGSINNETGMARVNFSKPIDCGYGKTILYYLISVYKLKKVSGLSGHPHTKVFK